MTTLDELKDKLSERVRDSRVSSEMQNLSGQFFAGTIWKVLLRAGLTSLGILVGLWAVTRFSSDCTRSCLVNHPGICCWSSGASVLPFVALGAVAFAGSFLTTKWASDNHFQISALVSTFVLIGAIGASLTASVSILFTLVLAAYLFLALFYGYRAGL